MQKDTRAVFSRQHALRRLVFWSIVILLRWAIRMLGVLGGGLGGGDTAVWMGGCKDVDIWLGKGVDIRLGKGDIRLGYYWYGYGDTLVGS